MKKSITFIVLILIVLLGIVFSMANNDTADRQEQNKVGATIFPIYDIAKQIAGDEFEVVLLLPAGASPHTFDPRPSLLKDLEGARAVFAIGYGLDNWSDTLARSVSAPVVRLDHGVGLRSTEENTDGHNETDGEAHEIEDEHTHEEESDHADEHADTDAHGHGPTDPHYWLSIHNAKQIAINIADELSRMDSENAHLYAKRAEQYTTELEVLEEELKSKTAGLSDRNIISLHDAWYYFTDEFGFNLVGTFEPSAGKEPTPKYLADLEKEVERQNVSTIFIEPQLSQTSIQAFANDHNLSIAVIDPLGGVEGRSSYKELMRYNVEQVVNALKDNE